MPVTSLNDMLKITDDRLQTIIGNRQIKNMEVSLLANQIINKIEILRKENKYKF